MGKNSMKPAAFIFLLILPLASCAVNPKINAIDPVTGMSPLAKAIAQGNVRKVKSLIKAGADIYAESYSDFIFLTVQNAKELPLAVQHLLEAGARLDPSSTLGDYYLYMDLDRTAENAAFFDALIALKVQDEKHLSDLLRTDLYNFTIYPAEAGISEKVLSEGSEGTDFNYNRYHNIRLYRLHSPLKQAVYKQNIEIARLLLNAAQDPAEMANRRYTYLKPNYHEDVAEFANHLPLSLAMRSGNIEMVKLLLDAGAWTGPPFQEAKDLRNLPWVYLGGNGGYLPLDYAINLKDIAMIIFLLDYGVDPDYPASTGYPESTGYRRSPLCQAAVNDSPEIVRLLLDAGANVNLENKYIDNIPITQAVKNNNIEITRMLLEAGAQRGQRFLGDHSYYVPLVWAVKEKNVEMVKLLIDMGEDINLSAYLYYPDHWSHTPLTQAIDDDDMDMVHFLLSAGADINTPGYDHYGPLQTAIRKKNNALTLELVNKGAELNKTKETPPLLLAAQNGDIPLMRILLEKGASIFGETEDGRHTVLSSATSLDANDFKNIMDVASAWGLNDVNYKSKYNWTALHWAARNGNADVMKMLIDRGADVNAVNKNGNGCTPLHYALGENRNEEEKLLLAQLLISAGADVNIPSPDMEVYIDYRTLYGEGFNYLMVNEFPQITELLIKAGADLNARDSEGRTALMFHSWFGHSDSVKMLVDAGADVNLKNPHGETALMYATAYQNRMAVEILIAAGADVNARSNNGDTPLMFELNEDIIRALVLAGADKNIQNDQGATILIMVLERYWQYNDKQGRIDLIKFLLDNALKGNAADKRGLNLKDRYRWSALNYAASESRFPQDLLQLMINAGAEGKTDDSRKPSWERYCYILGTEGISYGRDG